jgi:hypothetical protein
MSLAHLTPPFRCCRFRVTTRAHLGRLLCLRSQLVFRCCQCFSSCHAVLSWGFHRLNDYPFWQDEPWFNTTQSRCKLLSEAMASQTHVVDSLFAVAGLPPPAKVADRLCTCRSVCSPPPRPPFRAERFFAHRVARTVQITFLWDEMIALYLSGDLIIPNGTVRGALLKPMDFSFVFLPAVAAPVPRPCTNLFDGSRPPPARLCLCGDTSGFRRPFCLATVATA